MDGQCIYIQLLKPLISEVIGPYFTLLQDVPIQISNALRYHIFTQPPYYYSCPPTEKERLEIQTEIKSGKWGEINFFYYLITNISNTVNQRWFTVPQRLIFTALENIQRICSTIQGAEFTYNVYLKTSQGKLKCLVWVNFGLHLLCVLKRELANALVGGNVSLSVSTVGDFSTSLYTIYKETSESSTEGPWRVWTWAVTKYPHPTGSFAHLVHLGIPWFTSRGKGFSRQIWNSVFPVNHGPLGAVTRKNTPKNKSEAVHLVHYFWQQIKSSPLQLNTRFIFATRNL